MLWSAPERPAREGVAAMRMGTAWPLKPEARRSRVAPAAAVCVVDIAKEAMVGVWGRGVAGKGQGWG